MQEFAVLSGILPCHQLFPSFFYLPFYFICIYWKVLYALKK